MKQPRIVQYSTLIILSYFSKNVALMAQVESKILDSISVQSHAKPTIYDAPIPVQILRDSALMRLNSFSVADAMRYFSGVQIKDYGGIGGLKTVDVRNLGVNHTGMMYNGVPIGNMQNGQIDLGKFSLDNIEEISLYNAGTTNLLQPASAYASGATIYLKTKEPHFSTKNTQGKISFKTGSFGLINPSILFEQKLNQVFSAQINAEMIEANGRYKFRVYKKDAYDTTVVRSNADITAWRAEGDLLAKWKNGSHWQTHLYFYQSKRGLPGAVVSNKFYNPQRLWDKNIFVQSQYTRNITKFYQSSFIAKYSYDFNRYFDPLIVGVDGALNNYYRNYETYLSWANKFDLKNGWTAQLSGDYKYSYLTTNLYNFAYPSRHTALALAAVQYQKEHYLLQANVLETFIHNKVKLGEKAPDRREYTPTFDFSVQPLHSKNFRVRGFYKNIFRMPTFNDLYYTSIGTVSLNPEFAKQFDLGVTYFKNIDKKGSLFSFQIDGFHNSITNKIIAIPSQNLFRWRMTNLGKVHSNGVTSNFKLEEHWAKEFITNFSIQYTYEKSTNVSPNTNAYGFPVPYTPRHSGSAIINTQFKSWEFNYSYLYTGARYNVTDITLPDSKLQPWYTHDLNIVKNFHWKQHACRIAGEVNNVLNQQYEVILSYPMPGRNYKLILSYNF